MTSKVNSLLTNFQVENFEICKYARHLLYYSVSRYCNVTLNMFSLFFVFVFMYYFYKPITVQDHITDFVSWVPR